MKQTKISCTEETRLKLKKLASHDGMLMSGYIDRMVDKAHEKKFGKPSAIPKWVD